MVLLTDVPPFSTIPPIATVNPSLATTVLTVVALLTTGRVTVCCGNQNDILFCIVTGAFLKNRQRYCESALILGNIISEVPIC